MDRNVGESQPRRRCFSSNTQDGNGAGGSRQVQHWVEEAERLDELEAERGLTGVEAVSRPFPSWNRSISTEIYLCHACSDHESKDGNARTGQSPGHHHRGSRVMTMPAAFRRMHNCAGWRKSSLPPGRVRASMIAPTGVGRRRPRPRPRRCSAADRLAGKASKQRRRKLNRRVYEVMRSAEYAAEAARLGHGVAAAAAHRHDDGSHG
jgi:hypothetical protein